jgi:hypothetical protein
MHERLKSQHLDLEPSVTLLVAAYDQKSIVNLALLAEISQMLRRTLPGAQSIRLVVFFPPSIASEPEKITTYRFFCKLEKMVFSVPFLNIVFVNAISHAIYENADSATVEEEVAQELLYRQVMDTDFDSIICSFGAMAIANKTMIAGRSGCYAMSGACQLVYQRNECLNYLAARLQKDIWNEKLLNIESMEKEPDERRWIQDRSDAFILSQVKKYNHLITGFISGHPPVQAPDAAVERHSDYTESLSIYLNTIVDQLHKNASATPNEENPVAADFQQFLIDCPGCFAGASLYVDMLAGKRLLGDEELEPLNPSGIDLFQDQFFRAPVLAAAHEKLNKRDSGKTDALSLDFIGECIGIIENHSAVKRIGLADALRMGNALLAVPTEYGKKIASRLEAINHKHAASEDEFKSFEKEIGFWGRTLSKRTIYKERVAQIKEKIIERDKSSNALHQEYADILNIFMVLFDRVVIPAVVLAFYNERFSGFAQTVIDQFNHYRTELDRVINERWRQASVWTQIELPIRETVLNKALLDALYAQIKKEHPQTNETVFIWRPRHLPKDEIKKLTYSRCQNAADYYLAGNRALPDILNDYAIEQIEPVRQMSLLDIIEIGGRQEAYRYLKAHLDLLDKFLDMNSGLMPIAYEGQKAQKMLVIRADESTHQRFAPEINRSEYEYNYLFGPETQRIHSSDDTVIDMTCFQFGLPAFVIHGLTECRDLFKQNTGDVVDLWPERTT